jgi:predicted RNA polymerase sigma factor
VRGRLLAELGQFAEAEAAFSAALACDCTEPEKRFLKKQIEFVRLNAPIASLALGLSRESTR